MYDQHSDGLQIHPLSARRQAASVHHVKRSLQVVKVLGLERQGPVVGRLLVHARTWQYSHPAYHPAALEQLEPQSLPPDALVDHLKAQLEAEQS